MQRIRDLSVSISLNRGRNATYNPGEKMLISCSTSADCAIEVQLEYPDRSSKILTSNQVLRQGGDLILERKVPNKSGIYVLTLYGKTPFGTSQDSCSFICKSEGSLVVESTSEGADVHIDTVYYGSSPVHIENIPVGIHKITVTKKGYHEWKSEIIVEEGLKTTVRAVLTRTNEDHEPSSGKGYIYVRSEPSGADVYLDGIMKGIAPLLMEDVPAGAHTIKVTKEEFRSFDQVVNVTPGKPILVSAGLSKGHGSIQVFTSISEAEVHLDNEYEGIAPLTLYNVPEGIHGITLVKWGYEIWSSSLYVKPNETATVYPNVDLLWIWYIVAIICFPFYKLKDILDNLWKRREFPPYVPELSSSKAIVTSEMLPEPKEPVPLCPFCNQELHVHSAVILECSYCDREGLSCRFHELCWKRWLDQTHGQRKCVLYPAFVGIPPQKIRVVKAL